MSGFKYEIQAALCTWGPRCLKNHASGLLCPKKGKIVNVHCILGQLGFLPVEAEGMRRDILLNLSQWHGCFFFVVFFYIFHTFLMFRFSFQTEVWLKRCACIGQTQTNVNSPPLLCRGKLYPGHLCDIAGTDYTYMHTIIIYFSITL